MKLGFRDNASQLTWNPEHEEQLERITVGKEAGVYIPSQEPNADELGGEMKPLPNEWKSKVPVCAEVT